MYKKTLNGFKLGDVKLWVQIEHLFLKPLLFAHPSGDVTFLSKEICRSHRQKNNTFLNIRLFQMLGSILMNDHTAAEETCNY